MTILVTGGAGFIGSHIVDLYIENGHDVVVIDNLTSGSIENVHTKAKFYELDLYSDKLDRVFAKHKIEVINHHAAQIDLRKSIDSPVFDARINIEASIKLFQCGVSNGIKRIIFASSGGAVYGEQTEFPAKEKHITNPLSPYGVSKLSVEKYVAFYNSFYGINYSILRYANVYGPRQSLLGEAGVVAVFCKRILAGKQPKIYGDGTNTRDFVYAGDVAEANLKVLKCKSPVCANISTGVETNVNEIFTKINTNLGNRFKEMHEKEIPGEQKRSVLDFGKAKKEFGWSPRNNIDEGLKKTCDWFRSREQKN